MGRLRSLLAGFCLALVATGCGGERPPPELHGMWSAGQGACAAGIGVRFGARAIEAVYGRQSEILFERPRYRAERAGAEFRVRIVYDLPRRPGGAHSKGARGMLVLARNADGGLAPRAHHLSDRRTGSARLRLADDPAFAALRLHPCAPQAWREGVRGFDKS